MPPVCWKTKESLKKMNQDLIVKQTGLVSAGHKSADKW
jgi:hypothetical protein